MSHLSTLPEIKQDRVTDTVYHILRRNILQQRFKPGERLRVEELAQQLDVSRTPVREALNLLNAEGLVDIVPRSGTFVTQISIQDIEDTFELRCVLEGLAVGKVAQQSLSKEYLKRLSDLLDWTGKDNPEMDEIIQHAEANRAFHEYLIELSGNQKLSQIYRMLNAHTMMGLIHYSSPEWYQRWALEREEHEAILEALERGDVAGARKAMEDHLQRAKASLIEDMQRYQQVDPNER